MPTFSYRVRDERGKSATGTIDTIDRPSAMEKLESAGLYVTALKEEKKRKVEEIFGVSGRAKLANVAVFSREFATMINAGLPLLRALTLLTEHVEDKALQKALRGVRSSVQGGSTLAEGLGRYPRVFSELFVNSIAAGESAGTLDVTLNRLADYLEREMERKRKIRAALFYPVILVCFALAVVVGFSFILPNFIKIFQENEVPLPKVTQLIYGIGNSIRTGKILKFIGAILGGFVLFQMFVHTKKGRLSFDTFKLNIPVLGKLIRRIEADRFSMTLGTLIGSGLPLLRSLELLSRIAVNKVVSGLVQRVAESVRRGDAMSKPISESDLFPPMVGDMMGVGEESGDMEGMLQKVSDFFSREVDDAIKKLTSLIEPILLVFVGAIVACIALSILLPVFKMASVVRRQV